MVSSLIIFSDTGYFMLILLNLTLTLVVYLPPSYQGHCPCSGGPFFGFLVTYLFLCFVLLVYSFLIHIIGFSK